MVNSISSVVAVIPARGGSKGLPGKNIRSLGRHPLIAYSVASCLAAKTIDRVIVSTDNQEIANVACAYGAEAPFLRPAELSTDCLLYTSPSPRDATLSRMPSSA